MAVFKETLELQHTAVLMRFLHSKVKVEILGSLDLTI